MLVAIGSSNPVKINAIKSAFKSVFKRAFKKAEFVNFKVNSSVSEQPFGRKEIIEGAVTRAKQVRKKAKADFGVGLEGGVIETDFGMMSSAWCAIFDKKGKIALGGGMHYPIPKIAAKRIRRGEELGSIMDDLTGKRDVKKHGGTIEVITKGLLTRTQAL